MNTKKSNLPLFLKDNPQNSILILRHAHRKEHTQGSFGHDLELTEKGRQHSFCLGQLISNGPLIEIHTSPVLRCVQTAEEILKGANQKRQIVTSKILGDPGPFIADCKKAGPLFLERSIEEIAHALVNGRKLSGMRSLEEGARIFLNHIFQFKHFPCVMISHDIIICLLECFLLKSKNIKDHMPDFLEGFSMRMET